jgi:hypothetical protein
MNTDSSGCEFTITEIGNDDLWLKEFANLPEEEKQSSLHVELQLLPCSHKLEIEERDLISWRHFKLTTADFKSLEALGLRGKLRVNGGGSSGEEPFTSRTLIVAQHPIKEPVDLPQPNNCEVIYYQVAHEWRKFPAEAPVLKKRFRLTPDPANQALYYIWDEAYFGSDVGGGGAAFNWARSNT